MVDVIAHRGVHYDERENTLASFITAVALGVDGVELDVRETLDGELVVHHDAAANGLVISQTTRAKLPAYIPGLDDALGVLKDIAVNVEVKNIQSPHEPTYDETGDIARRVITAVRDGGRSHDVILTCFDLATCAVARSFDRDLYVGWLTWNVDVASALVQAHVLDLNAVNPYFSLVTEDAMREARALHLDVNVWTVNTPSDVAHMSALGVTSVITDDPIMARQVLAHRA
jgi:glycerophosphoryl diester phosphodiesterase